MYAIRNKITGQWLYGTDYSDWPPWQRISNRQAKLFETLGDAMLEFRIRECNEEEYEIVKVRLIIDET